MQVLKIAKRGFVAILSFFVLMLVGSNDSYAQCSGVLCTDIVCPVGSYYCEDGCTLGTCNSSGGNNQITCKQVGLVRDTECSNSCVYSNQCDTFSCHPVSNNCDQVACGEWYCQDNCGGKNFGTQCSPGLSCQGQFAGATCVGSQPTPTPIPQETNFWCYKCGSFSCSTYTNDQGAGWGCFPYTVGGDETQAQSSCESGFNACPAPTTVPPTNTPVPAVATSTPVPPTATAVPTATPRADQWLYCPKVDFTKSDGTPVKAGYCAFTSGGYADQNSCQTALQTSLSGKTTDTCYPSTSAGVDACNTACATYRPGGPTPIGATATPKPTAAPAPICRADRP